MSSEEIVSGITKGILDWSYEKIDAFVKKLKEKKLAFIQDPKTIELVKEQYNSGESKFYEKYITDKKLLLLARMGLTLRKLENDIERKSNLRNKIFQKYGVTGLHITEFVQNNILNRYIGILIESLVSIKKLEYDIKEVLEKVDAHTIFVQATTKKEAILRKAVEAADSQSPIFIVAGFMSAAKIVSEISEQLKEILKNYDFEGVSSGEKEILFFRITKINENQ